MKFKRILGFIVLIGGLALVLISHYISTQVGEGKSKISKAQKQVDMGNDLFSLSPSTKALGKGVTGSAQKKIDAGKQQVGEYEELAENLQMGGIVVALLGVVILFISRKKK